MLSSGVEALLDSSGSGGIEEVYPGLPTSISTELMAVSEPKVGLSAKPGVSVPVLAHGSGLSVEHCATPGVESFCQGLGDVLQVISRGPAESLGEELVKSGDLEEDKKSKKRNFRRLDYSSEGYQRGGEQAQDAEDYHTECCTPAPGGSLEKQEDPHLNQHELKSLGTCCTEAVGSLKNTGPKKRELGACEEEEVSSLTAHPSKYSASVCGTCPLLSNRNIQAEKTLRPMENQCLVSQSEFNGLVPGSKQHLESLSKLPNTGLQTEASSVEETKISIGSSQSKEILLKTGNDLPPVAPKCVREDNFQGTLKESAMDLDSLHGERNEHHSGDVGFVSELTEEKTIEQKECKNRCEREGKGSLEQSFSDSKSHCSQHACFIKCAEEKAEPVLEGNKMQQSLPKAKSSVEDQENPVSAQFLPFSSIPGSLSYKPESMNVLSETENKDLSIKSILSNSSPQLTFEPCKETDTQKGVASSHFRKFDIQDSSNETQVDSETPSALDLGISLLEKEKQCLLSGNTQMDNCDSSAAEAFSQDSSSTLSVTMSEGQDTTPTLSVSKENEVSGSERLDQIQKCQVPKQKKKCKKMEEHLSDKAQQEQKSEYQGKAKITLRPSMLHSSGLLCSSSGELVTSRNTKFESPSEEIFAVGSSENKLCSTLQEVKRPKITTDVICSQFLKTQDSEMQNLNLNLGYDGIAGAFRTTTKQREPLPLKRQPGRTCKKVPISYQLKGVRKSKNNRSSPSFEIPPEVFPKQENTLLEALYFPCKPPAPGAEAAMRCVHMPRQRAKRCSLLNSLRLRKCTKEPALLSKLSAMASQLLAPAESSHKVEPLQRSAELLPVGERYSQRRYKNLSEAFSCINRNLHSRWADSWCTKMFSFQPLALYPVESTKILFSDLSHKPPTSFLDTTVFPISFHIKLNSSPVTDLTVMTSQHSVHHGAVLREMPAPPSEWTFSFFLSQSCSDTTAFQEDSSPNNELHSSLSLTTPGAVVLRRDRQRNAIAERRGGSSMAGLHTVLAISSPGCYRIWTRRRNLTSHIPTIQRLFISQFAQGLKGARYPPSVSDDFVSSLPYSLGRVLSIWSQHGPSAWPSEITPLHSNDCKWQPSVGIANSYAITPHLPIQSMEALQTEGHEICLETSFPLPLPKPCSHLESSPSPPRLPAPELQVHALDGGDASVPACLSSQDDKELEKTETEKRPKKVSQIPIRKTVPKPDPNLTPMGLPKPKRLKKKEFSLEEIYTNKNYKSPPPARSLETIFEEPKEKNGCLISVSQQKRKRILEFQDFTVPRKRKRRGKIKAVGSFTRAKKAALPSAELDALLSQKLMDLDAFFANEAEQEQASEGAI
ncbi:protein PRR14L isoform X2 [Lathamus discolor]|uniref:protein PRR14L isoform X2 n=1 Tax=Lathamus discolor TaxID=678569 RepID=UPI0032B81DE8